MGDDRVLTRILSDAGLQLLPGEVRPREGRAWLVGWQGTRGVLRQLPVPVVSGTVLTQDVGRNETGMLAQVQWLSVNAGAVADALAAAVP